MYLAPPAPRSQARLVQLGSGIRSVDRFVRELQRFKRSPGELWKVRRLAKELVADLPPNDDLGEVRMLWEFVRDGVRYVRDVRNVDTLQAPSVTIETLQGDCDDKSLLLASLLETIGYATRFAVAATDPRTSYNHVFVEAFVPRAGKWIPLESSIAGFPFGKALRSFEPLRRYE